MIFFSVFAVAKSCENEWEVIFVVPELREIFASVGIFDFECLVADEDASLHLQDASQPVRSFRFGILLRFAGTDKDTQHLFVCHDAEVAAAVLGTMDTGDHRRLDAPFSQKSVDVAGRSFAILQCSALAAMKMSAQKNIEGQEIDIVDFSNNHEIDYMVKLLKKRIAMVRVEFLGPIGLAPREVEARSLKELAKELSKDPEVKKWLSECAVAVNDKIVKDIDTPLKEGDKVALLPPVCGG